jgi:tetratricopeptide (TPR) repeat protein
MMKSIRSAADGLEPTLRAYVLDRVALGLSRCESGKARSVFAAAFNTTLGIPQDAENVKVDLQTTILKHLLKADESHIDRWLALAETEAQNQTRTIMISRLTTQGKLDQALEVLRKLPADSFPYEEASNLFLAFQRHRDTKALQVFSIAVANYRQAHNLCAGCYGLANLLVRCWDRLPVSWAIEAINEILEDADKDPESATIVNGVAFASEHEYLAYELIPVLSQLDKNEVDTLLETYSDLRRKVNATSSTEKPVASAISNRQEKKNSLIDRMPEITYDEKVLELGKLAQQFPRQAMAAALDLPLAVERAGAAPDPEKTNPRAEALLAIAYATAARNASVAEEAIAQLLNAMDDLDAFKGVDFCVRAANVAHLVGYPDLAMQSLREGIRYYERLYAADTNAEDPNLALKVWWPSFAALSKLVRAAHQVGLNRFDQSLEITDPEVMLLLKTKIAGEMVGVPEELAIQVRKKKSHRNFTTTFED